MAPKNKKPSTDSAGTGASKQKGAQSINVRHILCEKHSKKEEVIKKLSEGSKFDEVAREFSEDKARAGMHHVLFLSLFLSFFLSVILPVVPLHDY